MSTITSLPAVTKLSTPLKSSDLIALSGGSASEPRESFMGTVTRNVAETAVEYGDMTAKGIGGMTGIGSITLGLYAGVAGGALFLGLLGAGAGPVVASASSHGLFQFAATSFATAGAFAKAGIIVGGTATAIGGFKVGNFIGRTVGTLPGWVIGGAVGAGKGINEALHKAAEGAAPAPEAPAPQAPAPAPPAKPKTPESGLGRAVDTVISGVGAGSGVIGGAMIGAGVASAGSLASGLLASNVSLAAITSTGLVGAAVGGVVFGAMGLVGGATLAKGLRTAAGWVYEKTLQGRRLVELDKKEKALSSKETEIRALGAKVEQESTKLQTWFKDKSTEVGAKVDELNQRETTLADKETHQEQIIETRAQQRYDEKSTDLKAFEQALGQRQGGLDQRETDLRGREQNLESLIETRATDKYTERARVLEGQYQEKSATLDARGRQLDQRQAGIESEVSTKVNAQVQPLRDDLDRRIRTAQADQDAASRIRVEAEGERSAARGIRVEADRLRDQASREYNEAQSEKTRFQRANADVQRRESEVEVEKQRLLQKEAELNRWEADLRQRGAKA